MIDNTNSQYQSLAFLKDKKIENDNERNKRLLIQKSIKIN